MGGRVAEELVFGYEKVTSGASSDIQHATKMARAMVTQWGMSDKVGPLYYGTDQQEVFLGHSFSNNATNSEAISAVIDAEVKRIVDEGYERARTLLTEHGDQLDTVARALLEYETLTGDEIKALMRGENLSRPTDLSPPPEAGKSALPSRSWSEASA